MPYVLLLLAALAIAVSHQRYGKSLAASPVVVRTNRVIAKAAAVLVYAVAGFLCLACLVFALA